MKTESIEEIMARLDELATSNHVHVKEAVEFCYALLADRRALQDKLEEAERDGLADMNSEYGRYLDGSTEREAYERAAALAKHWAEQYPIDIFPEPEYATTTNSERHAAKMARRVATKLEEEILALIPPQNKPEDKFGLVDYLKKPIPEPASGGSTETTIIITGPDREDLQCYLDSVKANLIEMMKFRLSKIEFHEAKKPEPTSEDLTEDEFNHFERNIKAESRWDVSFTRRLISEARRRRSEKENMLHKHEWEWVRDNDYTCPCGAIKTEWINEPF